MHMQQMPIYSAHACPADTNLMPNAHAADLEEAPMNDLNNPVLLLRRHLVIAG